MSTPDAPPSKRHEALVLQWWPVLAFVFAFGGGFSSHLMLSDEVASLREQLQLHQDHSRHPDNTHRVDQVIYRVTETESDIAENKSAIRDLNKSQSVILRRLDRICAAMPRCRPEDLP